MLRGRPRHPARLALAAACAAGVATVAAAPWYFQPRSMIHAFQRRWARRGLIFEVETDEPLFALTFDDGPHPPYTDAVLDLLAEHGARATFFVMGEQVERHPHLLARIIDEGHEVANHFYSDVPTVALPDDQVLRSLDRTEALIEGHNPNRLVRPAGALIRASTLRRLSERGYTAVLGSAYASDPLHPPVAYIRWALCRMLEPGRIMVLHDGRRNRSRTVASLPAILEEAQRRGLRAVTVSELLQAAR